MFRIKSTVSVRRIENGDGDAFIYKVSSTSVPQVKACVPQRKTMTMIGYPELPLASAPPEPWYFPLYPIEVIIKAETVLEKTWPYLSVDHQTQFLEFYLNLFTHNLLE